MNNISTNDANGPSSSNDVVLASRNAFDLVTSLTGVFCGRAKFSISTQVLDRQNSPELMQIKEKVKAIPRIEFQTLADLGNHLQDSHSRLEEYQYKSFSKRAFLENAPEFKQAKELGKTLQWIAEEKDKFGLGGKQFINRHGSLVNENILQTQEAADRIQLKICAIHTLRDKTEYWQGFWDTVKDKLLPDASIADGNLTKPIVSLALWVADLIVSGVVYDRSWEREKFLEVLDIWEDMLTRDHKILMETRSEITEYLDFMTEAETHWSSEVGVIWFMNLNDSIQVNAITRCDGYLKDLEVVESLLSLAITPFKQALDQTYPFYGPGISVHRDARDFCDDIPYVLIYLRKLLTAKGIIHNNQQEQFQEKVHHLARIIYGRLEQIEELCGAQWSKPIDPRKLAAFLQDGTADFLVGTDRVIQAIKTILETEVSERKKAQALKKRKEWDRRLRSWNWKDRPLTTSAGALEVLNDLETIIRVIHRFSVSTGTGTNMASIEGLIKAQRSYVEFNHSNSLLRDFYKVLREEIQQGSIEFPESLEKGTTETKTTRRDWRAWIKSWRKTKPEALISGL